jgi:hypothetical protein
MATVLVLPRGDAPSSMGRLCDKIKAAGKAIPASPIKWPLWEMTAATIAYVAWTFALPSTPFAQMYWYSPGLAAFLILVVSAGLGILAPLMQRKLAH